jgi:hypothetical protein
LSNVAPSVGRSVVPNVLPSRGVAPGAGILSNATPLRSGVVAGGVLPGVGSSFAARNAVQAPSLVNRATNVAPLAGTGTALGRFGNASGASIFNSTNRVAAARPIGNSFAQRYPAIGNGVVRNSVVGAGAIGAGAVGSGVRIASAATNVVGPYRAGYAGLANVAGGYVPGLRYNAYGYGGFPVARAAVGTAVGVSSRAAVGATSLVGSLLYGGYGYGGYGGYGYSPYGYGYGYRPVAWAASLVARVLFGPWRYGYGAGYGYGPYQYAYGYGGYDDYGGYPMTTNYTSYTSAPTYVTEQPVVPVETAPPPTTETPAQPAANDYALLGESAFRNGDNAGAVRQWQHAIVDDPQNATLVLLIGQALFAQAKYDEAAGAVQAALANMPAEQWGIVVANAGELYGDPAAYAAQVAALEAAALKASAAKSASPARQFLLGYYHGFLGDAARAVAELNQGLQLAPQDETMRKLRDLMQAKVAAATAPKTSI